ncbi:acyl-CoA dehydrogenase family protein [Pseudomonas fluorescens]|uniref:acyl-CoA dehydrogenase family protein n=1 Tax=Pseudomonas fluorescens TaxID=294 RepID=UPI001CD5FD63
MKPSPPLSPFSQRGSRANVDHWTDEHHAPKDSCAKAGGAGVLRMDIPKKYGGPGGDLLYRLVVAQ